MEEEKEEEEEERGMKLAAGSRIAAARVRRSQPPWLESKGIRAAGSPLCATCAVYPPPCVSGILLPLLTLPSSFLIICPPTLFHVPFFSTTCTRPEQIERSPAPPRPAESSSCWRRVSPRSAWKFAALSSLWRGVSRRRARPRRDHDRYPKSRLMSPSKCAKRSCQKSAELLVTAPHTRTRMHESLPPSIFLRLSCRDRLSIYLYIYLFLSLCLSFSLSHAHTSILRGISAISGLHSRRRCGAS